jgi:hypothetical protein
MPFGAEGSPEHKRNLEIFENVIRRAVVSSRAFTPADCVRVDLIDRPGSIVEDIVDGLHKADIVVADLTGKNPNVFYELGARHVLRRGTILVTQSMEDVPFHLRDFRLISYTDPFASDEAAKEFEKRMAGQIRSILDNPNAPDSPFFQRIEFIGEALPELELDMPIRQTHSSQELHIYNMFIAIRNRGYRTVRNLDWEAYWPAGIALKSKYQGMSAEKEDPQRRGYIRFRNNIRDHVLRPNSELEFMFVEFDVNHELYDSGELNKRVLLRVYVDEKPPLQQEFPLQGAGRVNF